jgi:tetratricopeptide (TPR) repeat protein
MISDSHPDRYYPQSFSYHLCAQCNNLRHTHIDYASALQALNHYQSAIVKLTRTTDQGQNPLSTVLKLPDGVSLKLKILSLCRLALTHSQNNKIPKALKLLKRSLQLSETLINSDPQQGQRYAAIILNMMGKLYITQRHYLFALASFQASFDAYRSLGHEATANVSIQTRMANVLCSIAHIAQITNYPDIAIEHYLEALWIFNQLGRKAQMHQIIQKLNQLFGVEDILASAQQ